jgi:hypothetical protein
MKVKRASRIAFSSSFNPCACLVRFSRFNSFLEHRMKLGLLGIPVLLACATPQAHAIGRLADTTVVDRESGATLPIYVYRGEYWVAGRPGARYAISVRTRLGERVLAVTSVDGVNVLSGETASWDQTGYVFGSHSQYQITGWRKSSSEVAAFEFSAARRLLCRSHRQAGKRRCDRCDSFPLEVDRAGHADSRDFEPKR